MKKLTAKQFDRKFWRENDPMTTPLWKMAEAYAEYKNNADIAVVICRFIAKWANDNGVAPDDVTIGIEYLKEGKGKILYLYDDEYRGLASINIDNGI